jgi:iron complex transport system substrate-binding protein
MKPCTRRHKPVIAANVPALLLLLAALLCAACSFRREGAAGEKNAVELADSFGRTVRLKEYPGRIVSLAPNMTETLFFLGAGDLIVGRTDYCDYPPEAAEIPSVGSITNPNIEYIMSLAPDLVVGATHFQKETLGELENLRIPVYLASIGEDYEEVFDMITNVSRIVGKTAEGRELAAVMRSRKDAVTQAVQGAVIRPRVYYMISFGEAGDFTAGRDTFISSLIKSAGGRNAGDDIEGWRYSVEALFREEPDIILCGPGAASPAELARTPPYNRLRAVREGRVRGIDSNLIDRIGPRTIDGLEMLAKIFHPDLFP